MRLPVPLFLGGLGLWAIGPNYLLLKVSVTPPGEVMTPYPTFLPHGLTLDHWRRLLATGEALAPLIKSLVTASVVAVAALLLAVPGLVVAGFLAWLFSWEEFVLATYLTLETKTMPLQLFYYLNQGNWFLTAAAAVLMTVPALLLTGIHQRHVRATSFPGAVR